jgi:hypothetical protein
VKKRALNQHLANITAIPLFIFFSTLAGLADPDFLIGGQTTPQQYQDSDNYSSVPIFVSEFNLHQFILGIAAPTFRAGLGLFYRFGE